MVEGDFKQGAEVTVDGELSFELQNPKSLWGTVFSNSYVDNDFYTVEDNEGCTSLMLSRASMSSSQVFNRSWRCF